MDERSKSIESYQSENSKGSPDGSERKRKLRKSKMSPDSPGKMPSKIEINHQDTVSGKVFDQLIQLKKLDHQASTNKYS